MARVSLPFQLLKTFTEKELINFERLLFSGYLSSNESLTALLKCLKKHAFHHESFTPALQCTVYKALYEKKKTGAVLNAPQSKKLNRLINDLLSVAEKFILFESMKETDEYDPLILYPKLIDRNQLLLYSKRLRAAEKKLSIIKKRDDIYHNQCYNVQKEKADLLFRSNGLGKEDNYDLLQKHLDIKFLLEKLQYQLAKITLQNRYPNKTFDFSTYEACEALFNLPQYRQNPLIQLYLLNIDLVKKVDEDTYYSLFNALQQYQENVPASFLRSFYANLNNYCALQIAKGRLEFNNNLLSTYKVMQLNNLLVKDNAIDIAILKNVVTVACHLKDFDWANKILDENIDYVSNIIRESVSHYNRGIIEFYKKNYKSAQDHFIKVRKIDEYHSVNLKVNLLQCFYETDKHYEDNTQQMIDSFRVFLSITKKLTATNIKSYKNFISNFNKLYNFKKEIRSRERCLKIKNTLPTLITLIKNQQFVWRKAWLLAKAEALKNDCTQYF